MTQHPLKFDPNIKANEQEFDSLSDTWSRADALLEELPRQRARKVARQLADNKPQTSDARADQGPKSDTTPEQTGEDAAQSGDAVRKGLLRN